MSVAAPGQGPASDGRGLTGADSTAVDPAAGDPGAATDPPAEQPRRERSPDLDRLIVFTDAVVAIALTLLVLDLKLPPREYLTDAALRTELVGMYRSFVAFGVSFAVISTWWWTNHRMFRHVYRYDGGLLALDIVWLATIVFLPFPTSVLSETSGLPTATALYACANGSVAVMNLVLLVYLRRRALVEPPLSAGRFRVRVSVSVIFAAVFFGSVPIAYLVGPSEAQFSWFLAAIIPWFVVRIERHMWADA
jgi:uncharacterized membrane protein